MGINGIFLFVQLILLIALWLLCNYISRKGSKGLCCLAFFVALRETVT